MSKLIDITGQKYGKLTVVGKAPCLPNNTNTRWLCLCDCGKETVVAGCHLKQGKIVSCGCARDKEMFERIAQQNRTHGESRTKLYMTWQGMKWRCYDPTNSGYKNYGGRGIRVCDEWKDDYLAFKKWALENGWDETLTIERDDVNGNYEPKNCRWATVKEQGFNKRDTVRVNYKGENISLRFLYEQKERPVHFDTVTYRLELGWDIDTALNTPPATGSYAKEYKQPSL